MTTIPFLMRGQGVEDKLKNLTSWYENTVSHNQPFGHLCQDQKETDIYVGALVDCPVTKLLIALSTFRSPLQNSMPSTVSICIAVCKYRELLLIPLPFLLNKLLTQKLHASITESFWTTRWLAICPILRELGHLYHEKEPSLPSSPKQKLFKWLFRSP